jgi:hypothetical protein
MMRKQSLVAVAGLAIMVLVPVLRHAARLRLQREELQPWPEHLAPLWPVPESFPERMLLERDDLASQVAGLEARRRRLAAIREQGGEPVLHDRSFDYRLHLLIAMHAEARRERRVWPPFIAADMLHERRLLTERLAFDGKCLVDAAAIARVANRRLPWWNASARRRTDEIVGAWELLRRFQLERDFTIRLHQRGLGGTVVCTDGFWDYDWKPGHLTHIRFVRPMPVPETKLRVYPLEGTMSSWPTGY